MKIKTNFKILAVIASVSLICAISAVVSHVSFAGSAEHNTGIDMPAIVVENYLAQMQNRSFSNVNKTGTMIEFAGYDPEAYSFQAFNDPDLRYTDVMSNDSTKIAARQYGFIVDRFGEDAWENATYKIVRVKCPETDGQLYYYDTLSDKYIDASEYIALKSAYYRKLSNGIGIEEEELNSIREQAQEIFVSRNGISNSEKITYEDIFESVALSNDHFPPVEIRSKELYDYYIVYFTFNDKNVTEFGETKFRIDICNKSGSFEICQGMRWDIPIVDNGDV